MNSISDARRKTIYEYHRVNFNSMDIKNNTLIYLKALPTCLKFTDCAACTNNPMEVAFEVCFLFLHNRNKESYSIICCSVDFSAPGAHQ